MTPISDSEVANRLLAELEEAGQENLPTLANTIAGDEYISELPAQFSRALRALIERSLVRFAVERDSAGRLVDMSEIESIGMTEQLTRHLVYSFELTRWTGGPEPWPEVVTTPEGRIRSRALLDQLGYRWWRNGAE
jgi:hypothetical protein